MVKVGELIANLNFKVARKFILHILLISSSITLIGTSVQLSMDYSKDLETIHSTFHQIDVSYRQSITNTLWVSNIEVLKIQLKGILKLRDMQHLEVVLEDKSRIQVGKPETKHVIKHEYIMSKNFGNREIHLGVLRVTASLRGVYRRLLEKVVVILLIQAIKTFIVSVAIFVLFYIIVGRHLQTIVRYAKSFSLNSMDKPLRLRGYEEKLDERNELSILVHSVNSMRNNLIREIEKRDQAEKQLQESERQLRLMFMEMSAGFALHEVIRKMDGTPHDYRFLDVNSAFEQLTGLGRAKIIGKSVQDIFPYVEKQLIDTFLEVAISRVPVSFERHVKAVGKHLQVVAYSPQKDRFAVILLDISKRKKAEEELAKYRNHLEEIVFERTMELRNAHEKLLAAERLATLGKVAGSISHELRNPLAVIDSSAYYLKSSIKSPNQRTIKHIERIIMQVKHSTAIIESLLDLTGISAPNKEKLDLVDLLETIVSRVMIPKTIDICKKMEERIFVPGDFRQLEMVIGNLIKNAVDAMDNQGVLTLSAQTSENGKFAEIAIKDTGSGILPEHISEIFKPLFSTKAQGIGFGLSICHQIVDKHGGFIDVTSEPGKGSSFIVKLPVYEEKTDG